MQGLHTECGHTGRRYARRGCADMFLQVDIDRQRVIVRLYMNMCTRVILRKHECIYLALPAFVCKHIHVCLLVLCKSLWCALCLPVVGKQLLVG